MLQLHEIVCSPGKDPHIGAVRRQCGYDGFLVVGLTKSKGFNFHLFHTGILFYVNRQLADFRAP